MPLQIRRGTDVERQAMTPAAGELIFVTNTNRLFVGNGVTPGGIGTTGYTDFEAKDAAAAIFTANNAAHSNINFTYNTSTNLITVAVDLSDHQGLIKADAFKGSVFADDSTLLVDAVAGTIPAAVVSGTFTGSVVGNLTGYHTGDVTGSIFADNSVRLIDGVNGTIELDGTISGNIIPTANEAYDIGSSSLRFRDLYLSGSSIELGAATITATGSAVNLPAGSTIDGVQIGTGGAINDYSGNIIGEDSSIIVDTFNRTITAAGGIFGNVTGNVFASDGITLLVDSSLGVITAPGGVLADLNGSIFADDSSIMLDAIDNRLFASGGIFGDVTGNVTGNVIGSDGSTLLVDAVNDSISAVLGIFDTLQAQSVIGEGGGLFLSSDNLSFPLAITAAHANDIDTRVVIRRSRGTLTSPASLINNDRLGSIQFNGHDGTNFLAAAQIQARITGTVSPGVMPTSLRFLIKNTIGVEQEAGRFNESGNLFLFANDVNAGPLQIFSGHNSAVNASNVILVRSRGAPSFPGQLAAVSAVQNGDPIFDFAFAGYDGTFNRPVAQIRVVTDGAVSAGVVPGRFEFFTTDTAGASASRVQIATTKTTFANMPVLPTYADEAAADVAIGGSGNRVNGMMYYDTAAAKIKAVAAGIYVALH